MFSNVGQTIKRVSAAVFVFQIILFIIIGAVIISIDEDLTFAGICIMIAGGFIGWLSILVIYGFGELVDRAIRIDETLNPDNSAISIGKCEICGKDDPFLKEIKFNDGTSITNKKVCQDCISKMESTQN